MNLEKLRHDREAAVIGQPLSDGLGRRDEHFVDDVNVTVARFLFPADYRSALSRSTKRNSIKERNLFRQSKLHH